MATRLDDRNIDVQMLINNQLDMVNHIETQEINRKDVEIANLILENDKMRNKLIFVKEFILKDEKTQRSFEIL